MYEKWNDAAAQYLSSYCKTLDRMIRGMTCVQLTDSISHNFIVQMIPHHRAAIEMCCNLLKYTNFEPLQRIAGDIIREQTAGIEQMMQAFDGCSRQKNCRMDLENYQRQFVRISDTMFEEMRNACADCHINADFIREMIPHHRGAIRMSENALRFDICPALCPILRTIIAQQKEGICKMERLLHCV